MNDKAKFHGEATMREEWGMLTKTGIVTSVGFSNRDEAEDSAHFFGGILVRRVVSTSQWVEVDA